MMVDIYIREKSGTREIRIPLLPEEISFESGDATVVKHEVMSLGDVAIPSGTELDGWSWKSEFPGELRQNDPMIRGAWIPPKTYDSILKDWKKNGTELNLLAVGYPINADVYLKEYKGAATGAFGDISYEIGFFEARKIVVTTTKVETATTTRPTTSSSTYTIKSGDTLWGISLKFYGTGTKWSTIYNANKDIIEATAKKYGRKSSDNGHWIYAGVTLTIPTVSGSGSSSTSSGSSTTKNNTPATTPQEKAQTEAYTSQRNDGVDKMVNSIKNKTLNNYIYFTEK